MQHIFCTECGSKNIYSGPKPKFCSSCGASIGSVSDKKRESPKRMSSASENLKEDETDIDHVPNIGKLDYDVSYHEAGHKTYKFGDVINAETQKRRNDIEK